MTAGRHLRHRGVPAKRLAVRPILLRHDIRHGRGRARWRQRSQPVGDGCGQAAFDGGKTRR